MLGAASKPFEGVSRSGCVFAYNGRHDGNMQPSLSIVHCEAQNEQSMGLFWSFFSSYIERELRRIPYVMQVLSSIAPCIDYASVSRADLRKFLPQRHADGLRSSGVGAVSSSANSDWFGLSALGLLSSSHQVFLLAMMQSNTCIVYFVADRLCMRGLCLPSWVRRLFTL